MDIKKDVLFLEKIMDAVQNEETFQSFLHLSLWSWNKFVIQVVLVCVREPKQITKLKGSFFLSTGARYIKSVCMIVVYLFVTYFSFKDFYLK